MWESEVVLASLFLPVTNKRFLRASPTTISHYRHRQKVGHLRSVKFSGDGIIKGVAYLRPDSQAVLIGDMRDNNRSRSGGFKDIVKRLVQPSLLLFMEFKVSRWIKFIIDKVLQPMGFKGGDRRGLPRNPRGLVTESFVIRPTWFHLT